ncbi:MAG: divergent polysaccharide deacetylase family protein [Pseudomonas sp.]|nr:divergent polysaccharide deacetylase family protein [Pseudomonas sp.]
MRFGLILSLLSCLAGAAHAATAETDATPHKAYLSLIIDDLGQNLPRDRRVLALPGPVTTAIMPDTPHATEFAREAHRAGKIVILHMPMDPATGPFAWHPDLPIEELEKRLNAAFKAVPYTSGINNHMGSRMTAEPQAMAWLMADLQRRHKFFVDSRTSAKTVAAAEAQKIGLASVSRDVFLDDERTEQAINAQLQTAISLARKQGSAVMIGHPYPQTLAVLERELPKLKALGIEWIDINMMISLRGNQATAAHGKNGRYREAP